MRRLACVFLCCVLVALCLPQRAPAQQLTAGCIQTVTSGGALVCAPWSPKLLNGLTSTVTLVTGSGGVLGTVYCYNANGSVAYLQIFDVATAAGVTVGTTVPKLSLGIPSALASGTGPTSVGIEFVNGIQVASTTSATGSSSATMDCNVTFN